MSAIIKNPIAELKKDIQNLKGEDFDILYKILKAETKELDPYEEIEIASKKAELEYKQALEKEDLTLIAGASDKYRKTLEDQKKTIDYILGTPIRYFLAEKKAVYQANYQKSQQALQIAQLEQIRKETIAEEEAKKPLDLQTPSTTTMFSKFGHEPTSKSKSLSKSLDGTHTPEQDPKPRHK